MKLFISQPMRGQTKEEIQAARAEALKKFNEQFPDSDCEVIDSILDVDDSRPPLYWLSRSLELLSGADLILMMPGWAKTRGCVIEYLCASRYGITICNQDDQIDADECINALIDTLCDTGDDESENLNQLVKTDKKAAAQTIAKMSKKLGIMNAAVLGDNNIYSALGAMFDELIKNL